MVVLVGTASVAQVPPAATHRRDPQAARDLVALLRAGERGRWLVTSEFTRRLKGGRVLMQSMQEGRSRELHVLVAGTSMTLERNGRAHDCQMVATRTECTESATGSFLPSSEVVRVAVAAGAYEVSRAGPETIAGERAACFRLVTSGSRYLPDLGAESGVCLAPDGISLRQRVVRSSGDIDDRVARVVNRRADTRAVESLARDFDASARG